MILTDTLSKEDINAIRNHHSTSPCPVEMVKEVKVAVMVFKQVPNNASPFEIVACRLQGNNEIGSFTNDVCEDSCELEKMIDVFTFTSFATASASLESLDIAISSVNFWRGVTS